MAHYHAVIEPLRQPGEPGAVVAERTNVQADRGLKSGLDFRSPIVEISVCIVNWNCRQQLRSCLISLLREFQGVALEVIVVDNGSQDGAPDMVATEFPEATLIRNAANRGFSKANNQAARVASGQHLLFLNNDTRVPPGSLERLLRYALAHPEIGLIGPALRDPHGRVQTSFRRRPTVSTFLFRTSLLRWTPMFRDLYRRFRSRRERAKSKTQRVEVLMGAAIFLSRELFLANGGWDEDFVFGGEDLDLCTRIGQRHPIVYLPSVEIIHHGRLSTRQHIGFASKHILSGFVKYLRKSGSGFAAIFIYKVMMTLDAPVQIISKTLQAAWRLLNGRTEDAKKSLLVCRGQLHFLGRGLIAFWR
ncbi:MAG TPA: glycosyltransferase family 2 protein, partial [Gemmataceae bacterium]|nr:glycosyltransferase family 2 protein [Gemmataceae bacterium]